MNIMEMLQKKLNQTTDDFYTLYQENQQLKQKIKYLQEQNDMLTRNHQHNILRINSKIKNARLENE